MIELDEALEPQRGRAPVEGEAATQLPNTSCIQCSVAGSGSMTMDGVQQALVVAVARAEHDPVLAEGHGLLVGVGGDVADGQERHGPGRGGGRGLVWREGVKRAM